LHPALHQGRKVANAVGAGRNILRPYAWAVMRAFVQLSCDSAQAADAYC